MSTYPRTIIACRPADMSVLGVAQELFQPMEPGWTVGKCSGCHTEIHIGKNQTATITADPGKYEVLCFPCIGKMPVETFKLSHLGGW